MIVGIRHNTIVEVLRERYADNFQFGFLAHTRVDVQVEHPESFAMISGISP